jgi:uncharacterized protein YjaZ
MQFTIIDTLSIYRRLLAEPDAAARETIFRQELAEPFAGLVKFFGGGDVVATFRQWGMSPDPFSGERKTETERKIDLLEGANAWKRAAAALEHARTVFTPYADRIPTENIVFALCLNQSMTTDVVNPGYSGFGAIPGYIMVTYSDPTPYNLARVEGATVHEFNHNVRSAALPHQPMIATVGDYIVAEGLAEAFAHELYGEEAVGPWVTDFDQSQRENARQIIGGALGKTGFDVVRNYIFGDTISKQMGREPVGLPDFAGYAIGYFAVRQYLARSGKTAAEATLLPAREILTGSDYFAGG